MIPHELLEILRCPRTGQKLALASAKALGQINTRQLTSVRTDDRLHPSAETVMHEPVVAALVTLDGRWLYPVRDDIPLLLSEEAIAL